MLVDGQGKLFASVSPSSIIVRKGYEGEEVRLRKLAADWSDVETLAAHKVSRDALQALLERWEQLFDQAQA